MTKKSKGNSIIDSLKDKLQVQIYKFVKNKSFNQYLLSVFAFIVIGSLALVYLSIDDFSLKPRLSSQEYTQVETELKDLFISVKDKPIDLRDKLAALPVLPSLLENRKNYVLSKLYGLSDEPALAFIKAYELDRNYLPEHASFRRAKLAERIGLEAVVVKELDFLSHRFPRKPKYLYELAKSYSRQSMFDEAKRAFDRVQKSHPDSEYATGAEYYLANMTSDREIKYQKFSNYLKKSNNGNLAYLISDQILSYSPEEQKKFADMKNHMALSYYHRENYKKAVSLFNVNGKDPMDLYLRAYAETLIKLRRKSEAVRLLLTNIPKVESGNLRKSLIEYMASLTPKYTAIANLKALKNKVGDAEDKALWEIAKRSKLKEDYKAIYTKFPSSFYAAESLSRVFWKEYERKNYHRAVELYKLHWEKYTNARSHSFVAFWAAKIYEKLEQPDDARAAYQNLIIEHPRDYYSFRANQILSENDKWFKLPMSNKFVSYPTWDWPVIYNDNQISSRYGSEVLELCKINQFDFLLGLDQAQELSFDKDFKMWLYAQAEDNLKAISTAYFSLPKNESPNLDNPKYQYAWPLAFADLVADEISLHQEVDPLLAHALIKQESRYQKEIVSKVGAVGLMQLMPYTARDLARTLGMRPPRSHDLMKPEINIKLGIRYMENVFRNFENNMIHAIASYNAGPVAVNKWKKKYSNLDADEFIESIPYPETKNYVKRVLNNYWIYQELYT